MILMIPLLLAFLLAYSLLISVYWRGWRSPKPFHVAVDYRPTTHLSVLIPARNEAENIEACLRSILQNDYPRELMEVIVIDDFSEDQTAALANALLTHPGDRVLQLKDHLDEDARLNAYKKKALEIAVEQASGDLVITVDADCKAGPRWLRSMAVYYEQHQLKCIAAPVTFWDDGKAGPVLFHFQLLDFVTMQGITAASLRLGLGNMCNGANFAFEKSAFVAVGGYKGIDQIASGDDMLLMDKIAAAYPGKVAYLKCPEAIMETAPQPGWRQLLNQRIRWASKTGAYKVRRLVGILFLIYFFNLVLFVSFLYGFFDARIWPWLLGTLLLKTVVELLFLWPVAGFFKQRRYLPAFPFLQPLHVLYILSAGFLGKFGRYNWKGRKVH